ncbi:hypothetical protein V8C86DRAFT_2626571, partial [Haematococcus lacustris]
RPPASGTAPQGAAAVPSHISTAAMQPQAGQAAAASRALEADTGTGGGWPAGLRRRNGLHTISMGGLLPVPRRLTGPAAPAPLLGPPGPAPGPALAPGQSHHALPPSRLAAGQLPPQLLQRMVSPHPQHHPVEALQVCVGAGERGRGSCEEAGWGGRGGATTANSPRDGPAAASPHPNPLLPVHRPVRNTGQPPTLPASSSAPLPLQSQNPAPRSSVDARGALPTSQLAPGGEGDAMPGAACTRARGPAQVPPPGALAGQLGALKSQLEALLTQGNQVQALLEGSFQPDVMEELQSMAADAEWDGGLRIH